MLFTFLLILHALIAFLLVVVILMQRSEGGGLGMGGSPGGLMSARGASDFLTRATAVLAVAFVAMSVILAGLATVLHRPQAIDTSLAHTAAVPSGAPSSSSALAPVGQANPLAPGAGASGVTTPASNGAVPVGR